MQQGYSCYRQHSALCMLAFVYVCQCSLCRLVYNKCNEQTTAVQCCSLEGTHVAMAAADQDKYGMGMDYDKHSFGTHLTRCLSGSADPGLTAEKLSQYKAGLCSLLTLCRLHCSDFQQAFVSSNHPPSCHDATNDAETPLRDCVSP